MPNTVAAGQRNSLHSEVFRDSLVQKRKELVNLYEHDIRVGQESNDENFDDFADRANNSYNREMMFSLSDAERGVLIQIDEAMDRLDNGSYGKCIHCKKSIGEARLKAVPWARFCITCQERDELGMLYD